MTNLYREERNQQVLLLLHLRNIDAQADKDAACKPPIDALQPLSVRERHQVHAVGQLLEHHAFGDPGIARACKEERWHF